MITDCPSCFRQFRIYAWQLSAAKGVVQCGFCGEQFNALERLHDFPLPPDDVDTGADDPYEQDEPQFIIPGEYAEHELIDSEKTSATVNGDGDSEHRPADPGASLGEDDALEILAPAREDRSLWGRIFWYGLILILMTAISLQLAWFNRDWILTRYPEYLPQFRALCDRFDCEVVRERDLSSIVLVNRDVRDHPRYVDVLLVNATIENRSDIVQPYPDIRLMLFDTEGRITGYRIFKPLEYLDASISVEQGMPMNMPVHIVLELTGASDVAVSFEFSFI